MPSWEQRLAIRYYNRLFKEYALVDLTYYKINKIGMRWRTEREVVDGKGQFSCGEVNCSSANLQFKRDLCSYEVPFTYATRDGKRTTTLVKVRLCGPCALRLYYRKVHEYEANHPSKREKRKRCETSKDIFDYINEVLHDGEEQQSLLPPPPTQTTHLSSSSSSSIITTTTTPASTLSASMREVRTPTSTKDENEYENEHGREFKHGDEPHAKRVKTKLKTKSQKQKTKTENNRCHYSSSSEDESEYEYEYGSDAERTASTSTSAKKDRREDEMGVSAKKEYDASGNEVISTSDDVWRTNMEVEHTEAEKMDDFINQLFM